MRRSKDLREYRFAPAWRARLAEFKLLSARARDKLDEAKRIACVADTSLLKQWFPKKQDMTVGSAAEPRAASGPPDCLERLTIMNMCLARLDSWPGEVFHRLCAFVGIAPGFHTEQLHLEEYAGLRCMEAIGNINMQLLVATKPFRIDKEVIEDANEEDLLPDLGDTRKESEWCGGEGEGNDTEDEEFDGIALQRSRVNFDLDQCRHMLARTEEVERAKAPGRHKDGDMHMKRYPGFLHDVNAERLPQLPADSSTTPSPGQAGCFTGCYVPSPHHAQIAAKHQQAVAILLRSDDDKHGATITLPSDFDEFV